MTTLAIRVPDDVFATLRRSPRELEGDVMLAAAIDWYRRGLVSQGRAAEIAGLPRGDFIDALAARRIEPAPVDLRELDDELAHG